MGKHLVRQKLAGVCGDGENDDAKEQQLHDPIANYSQNILSILVEFAIFTVQQLPISTKTVIEWMCSIRDSKGSYNGVAGRSPASMIVLVQ